MADFSKATPRPWKWEGRYVVGSDGKWAMDDGSAGGEYNEMIDSHSPNGQFIIEAVNNYDRLKEVEALAEELVNIYKFGDDIHSFERGHDLADELQSKIKEGKKPREEEGI